MKIMGNDKFMIMDATDDMVIGGFGNLKGNIGLLKYTPKEIEEMMKENNSKEDDIRLVNSLLESLCELKERNDMLKIRNRRYRERMNELATKNDKLSIEERRLKRKVLEETTKCCENCKSHECCPEEECAIFNIEKIVNTNLN